MKRSDQFAFYLSAVAVAGVLQAPLLLSHAMAAPAKAPAKQPAKTTPAKPAPAPGPAKAAPTLVQPGVPAQPVVSVQPAATGAVAAEVNNDKIMMADVDRVLNSMKARQPALAIDTAEAKSTLATLRQTILENMITHRLLYQE